jgi:hypothetical protein
MDPSGTYRGIVHAHSLISYDGTCGYDELRALFVGAGLDFACMTEHIEHLGQADIDHIIAECRRASDDRFLFVPGVEMDCFTVYFLGLRPTEVDFTDNRSVYQSLRKASRMCVLSHPIKARFRYPDWIAADCDAVEVMNNKHDGKFCFRPESEELLGRVRARRPAAVALAGLDFHSPEQMCPVHLRVPREGPLTEKSVLDALAAGAVRVYSGDLPLDRLTALQKAWRRGRIRLMDGTHAAHRALRQSGVRVPRPVRRLLSRIIEGG